MFEDRYDAGNRLAEKLQKKEFKDPVVISLPRGGVPLGKAVAEKLACPHTVLVVRKIGDPQNPEFGIGAIAENDVIVLNNTVIDLLKISEEEVLNVIKTEKSELERRVKKYRGPKKPDISNKTVILVDDGLATGITAQAAIKSIKKQTPKLIIFATPVCTHESKKTIQQIVDTFVCLKTSVKMKSVGEMYRRFNQLTDEEITEYLHKK